MTIPSCVNPCSVCQLDSNIHQHTECLNVSPCFLIVLCVFQNGEFYIFHYWGVQHSLCTVCSGKRPCGVCCGSLDNLVLPVFDHFPVCFHVFLDALVQMLISCLFVGVSYSQPPFLGVVFSLFHHLF